MVCLAAATARADVLLQYDFEGSNVAASTEIAGVSGADFGYSGDGQTNWYPGYPDETGTALHGTFWSTNGEGLAAHFSFAAVIDPGYVVDVTSLTFQEDISPFGPSNWVARYSVDSNTWYTVGDDKNSQGWGALETADAGQPMDLTGTVYFRIYGTNANAHAGTWKVDDVTLNGTVEIDDGTRVIRSRDFDNTHLDTWPTTTNVSGGTIQTTTDEKATGSRSLEISGSVAGNTNQNIVLANTDISEADDPYLSVSFAASQVDTDDDLHLDISYDNGVTWDGAGSVMLVDGTNQHSVGFGEVSAYTVTSNPWTVAFTSGQSQVAVRLRFEESGPPHNTNDHYYVDDIRIVGILEPPSKKPKIENYDISGLSATGATVRAHLQEGYAYPEVRLYWGHADGGTNTTGWNHETLLGTNENWGILSTTLTGLDAGHVYYCRFYAANTGGVAWAGSTTNFTTDIAAIDTSSALFMDSFGIGLTQPLCIDRDANGISDIWEQEYLGGLGQDLDTDTDGDGITNRYEQLAGTHPNDSNSYMRLVSVDLTGPASDNLTIQFLGGGFRGTTPFSEVGDKNERLFTVRTSDNAAATKTTAALVLDIDSGTNVWVDTNMVTETERRYYDVSVSYAGQSYSNPEEWAAYVQDRPAGQRFLICAPVNMPGGTNENNLNSRLGQQLARGLHADTTTANADKMRYMDNDGNWQEYFLMTNAGGGSVYWYDEGLGETANVPVSVGMPLWIVRGSGSAPRANTVFAGKSFLESEALNFNFVTNRGGWVAFGWPLARERSASSTNTSQNQLGFYDRGVGGTSSDQGDEDEYGDQIWVWDYASGSGIYTWKEKYWLVDGFGAPWDGRWWDSWHAGGFADITFEPGMAYYYRHSTNSGGTNFVWKPEIP